MTLPEKHDSSVETRRRRRRWRMRRWRRSGAELVNSRKSLWRKIWLELIVEARRCSELFADF